MIQARTEPWITWYRSSCWQTSSNYLELCQCRPPRNGNIRALTVIGTNSNYLIKCQLMSLPCQIRHCSGRTQNILQHQPSRPHKLWKYSANKDFWTDVRLAMSPSKSCSSLSLRPPPGHEECNESRTKTPTFPQLNPTHYPDLFLIMVGFLKILLHTLLPGLGY